MGTTWGPLDVETTWDNMETTWGQHEDNVETTWTTWGPRGCGDNMGTTWGPQGSGDHVGTTWRQHGDNMRTT